MGHYEGTPDVYIHPSMNHNHTIERYSPPTNTILVICRVCPKAYKVTSADLKSRQHKFMAEMTTYTMTGTSIQPKVKDTVAISIWRVCRNPYIHSMYMDVHIVKHIFV